MSRFRHKTFLVEMIFAWSNLRQVLEYRRMDGQ